MVSIRHICQNTAKFSALLINMLINYFQCCSRHNVTSNTFSVVVCTIWQCQRWKVLPLLWTFAAVYRSPRNQRWVWILNLITKENNSRTISLLMLLLLRLLLLLLLSPNCIRDTVSGFSWLSRIFLCVFSKISSIIYVALFMSTFHVILKLFNREQVKSSNTFTKSITLHMQN